MSLHWWWRTCVQFHWSFAVPLSSPLLEMMKEMKMKVSIKFASSLCLSSFYGAHVTRWLNRLGSRIGPSANLYPFPRHNGVPVLCLQSTLPTWTLIFGLARHIFVRRVHWRWEVTHAFWSKPAWANHSWTTSFDNVISHASLADGLLVYVVEASAIFYCMMRQGLTKPAGLKTLLKQLAKSSNAWWKQWRS